MSDTEFGSMLLGAFAELKLSFDAATEEIRKARVPPPLPALVRIAVAGAVPSSGDLALDCEGPANGQVWELGALWVAGVTPTTGAAGKAFVLQSPTTPLDALGSFRQGSSGLVVDQATTLPQAAGYSRGQITLRHPDRLWVVIDGGTATQTYMVTGQALNYTEAAYATRFAL